MLRRPGLLIILAVVLLGACGIGATLLVVANAPRSTGTPARINSGGVTVNLWRDYEDRTRGIAGTVEDGARVTVLERRGEAVRVRAGGVVGWVNAALVE